MTLEDVLEFSIVEGLVEPRPAWRDAVGEYRSGWETMQLRAAVRRNPDAAAAQLRDEGWTVTEPNEESWSAR